MFSTIAGLTFSSNNLSARGGPRGFEWWISSEDSFEEPSLDPEFHLDCLTEVLEFLEDCEELLEEELLLLVTARFCVFFLHFALLFFEIMGSYFGFIRSFLCDLESGNKYLEEEAASCLLS